MNNNNNSTVNTPKTLLSTLHSQSKKKPDSNQQSRQGPPSDRMAYACLAIIGLAILGYLAYELLSTSSSVPAVPVNVPMVPPTVPSPVSSASVPLVNALLLPANQIPPAL